jgi:hypothetical protein
MKQFIGILMLAFVFSGISSCNRHSIEKPDQLISKSKFVKMMADMYLIQAMNTETAVKPDSKKITQTQLYFSVLKKYSVADTVFVRSLMYYSSFPKDYEKMHVEIMDILNQKQDQFHPANQLRTKEE